MADNNYLAEYRRKQQERWAATAAAATAANDNAQNNTSVNNSNNNNATTAPQLIQEDPLQSDHQDATADPACNEDEINEIYATLAKEHAKLKQAQEEYDLEMARKLQEEFDAEYASSLSAEPTSRASSSSTVNNNNQQIQDNNDEEVNVGTADFQPYVDRLIVDDEVEEQQRNTFNYTRPLPPSATAATSNSQQATTTQIPVQHSYGNSTRRNQQRQQYTIEQPETNYHQEELAQQPHQQPYAQQYVNNQQRSPQANYQQVFEQVTYRTGPNGEPIRIRTVTRNNNGNVQTQEFIEPATRAVYHHQQQSPQQYLHLNGPTNNTGSTSLSLLNGGNRSLFDPFNQQEEETLPMSMFNRGSSQGFFDSDSSFRYMQRRMAQMRQQAAAMMFNL